MNWMENLVSQNDITMPKNFKSTGCFARCHLAIAEFCSLKALDSWQIVDILYRGMKSGKVFKNEHYLVGHPTSDDPADFYAAVSWLIDESFKALGNPRTGKMVGYKPAHESRQWEYCIIQWLCDSDNPDFREHHTLGGKAKTELWDPYRPVFGPGPKKIKPVMYRLYQTIPLEV